MSLSVRRPRIRIDTLAREAPKALLVDERRARPLWFDGQFLTASTFNREQTYLLTRQSDLALATGAGVVEGLQVEREGGSQTALLIRRGQGLAGNGEPLVVHEDLRIDLADIPLQRALDQATGLAAEPGPPPHSRSGLFVLGLAALEFTSNPIGAYPTRLDGERSLEDSVINEAVLVALIPFALRGTLLTPGMRRAQAAESIFVGGGEPELPAGVLPLAALELAGNTITWLDQELVRREAAVGHSDVLGLGIAPEPRRAAHIRQYHAMLDQIVAANPAAGFAASEHFLALPPVGRLPAACVGFTEQPGSTTPVLTQAFLPSAMPAVLSLIPEDELPALVEEALLLPPIPLGADEAVLAATPVTVFAPVARAAFEETLRQLQGGERVLPPRVNLGLAPLRPMDLLEALVTPVGRRPEPALSALTDEGWRALLEGRRWLWYARGRQIAPRDELFGVTSPFRLPGELPKEPQDPEQPEEPQEPDGADRNELEREVRLWAAGVGEEQRLLELRERSNDVGRERLHALLGDLVKRGDDLLTRGALFELHQLEKVNGTTIGPVQRRFAVPELGQGLPRIVPQLLADAAGEAGLQVRLLTAGDQTVEVIKIIREMTGLGLREAKTIVDSVPSDVPVGTLDTDTLRGFLGRLSALGARTEVLRGTVRRALAPAEVERRSQLLIASMALPELDEIGRKAKEDVLEQVIAKLADAIAGPIKPDTLREVILEMQRAALG